MKDKEFFIRKFEIVKTRLGNEDTLDDSRAMEIILEEVFSDAQSSKFSTEELDEIITKIFYKTRSRLGILKPLIEDGSVTEIMVNGPRNIFVEKNGVIEKSHLAFDSNEELEEIMRNVAADVHREINELNPIVDARLADGSRVNGVYKNVAVNGPILTIRKFSDDYMTMNDLMKNGTVDSVAASLLQLLVICGYNIFVSGGTSSGKTTLLNALSEAIPREERVIVIEDSSELKLNNIDNIVHLECKNRNVMGKGEITMSQLIKSSLRMRPDRIIVGEVRGGEVVDMLAAMNTGHQGSMSTGHGNSVGGMLKRLESMYLMSSPMNVDAIRSQIAEGIDILVHIEKLETGRKITQIAELVDYAGNTFHINPLLEADSCGVLKRTEKRLIRDRKVFLKGEKYAKQLQHMHFLNKR